MYRENCERCSKPTNGRTIMSMFNEDIICMECKEAEKKRNDYSKAVEADINEIKKGNYNFKGIGLGEIVGTEEFNKMCEKIFGGNSNNQKNEKQEEK